MNLKQKLIDYFEEFHKEGVLDTALEILNECEEDLQGISYHDLSWIKTHTIDESLSMMLESVEVFEQNQLFNLIPHTDIKETIKRKNLIIQEFGDDVAPILAERINKILIKYKYDI